MLVCVCMADHLVSSIQLVCSSLGKTASPTLGIPWLPAEGQGLVVFLLHALACLLFLSLFRSHLDIHVGET